LPQLPNVDVGSVNLAGGWADTEIKNAVWNANALSYMLLRMCFIAL